MNPTTGIAGCCALAASGHAAENGDELAPLHVVPLPWQLAQQLLRNAYDVVFAVM